MSDSKFQWYRGEHVSLKKYLPANVNYDVGGASEFVGFHPDSKPVTYYPLDDAGLYHAFIDVEPSPANIVAFANRYGMLGIGEKKSVAGNYQFVESSEQWRYEIELLRTAERLRSAHQRRSPEEVVELLRDDGFLGKVLEREEFLTRRQETILPWLGFFTLERFLSVEKIGELLPCEPPSEEELREEYTEAPAWNEKERQLARIGNTIRHLAGTRLKVATRLTWNREATTLNIDSMPANLLGAMWLQFAKAVEGNKSYVRCERCDRSFEINSPQGARRDKKYCSNSCRARACQLRKERERTQA